MCMERERERERERVCTKIEKNRNFAVQIRQEIWSLISWILEENITYVQ